MVNLLKLITRRIIYICLFIVFMHENVLGISIEKQMIVASKAEMLDAFHLMPNAEVMMMTEFDLLMTLEQYKLLHRSPSTTRNKRKAVRDVITRWTDCKVYYEVTKSLNSTENRVVIRQAIDEWEKYSCLHFIESNTAKRRIQFQSGNGCYSRLGMQVKPQEVVLAPGCRTKGIITHEIGHAIGWYHEHMRPDRDEYVTINEQNIPPLYRSNFDKYSSDVINTYDIPYDYNSIMHYGNDALQGSITTVNQAYQDKIGQRVMMTFKDIKLANIMYNCSSVMNCPVKTCAFNGFVLYNNLKQEGNCQCWCDSDNLDDPLVLCSSLLDKELPTPQTKPVDGQTLKFCYDVRDDCEEFILQDSNVCMKKMKLMMASCAKTCKFCDKVDGMCMDYEKGCPILAASGACEDKGLQKIMKDLCPESCGFCLGTDMCAIQQQLLGPNRGVQLTRAWSLLLVMFLFFALL